MECVLKLIASAVNRLRILSRWTSARWRKAGRVAVHHSFGVLIGIFVTIAGSWAWERLQDPEIRMQYAVAVYQWDAIRRGDSVVARTTLWDASTYHPIAQQRMIGSGEALIVTPPEHGIVVKIILENTGRSAATDIRIPIYADLRGTATAGSTPNVDVSFAEARSPGTKGVDVLKIPLLHPRTSAVITYELLVDSREIPRLRQYGPASVVIQPILTREHGTEFEAHGVIPYAQALIREGGNRADGASVLTHRWHQTDKPGVMRMEFEKYDTLLGGPILKGSTSVQNDR